MPFGAMASVVSDDPIQRSKLSRARSIGGTIVGIVGLSIVPVVCFDKQSNILPERFYTNRGNLRCFKYYQLFCSAEFYTGAYSTEF
mgnify:FL=1